MPVRSSGGIEIDRPIDEVFEYTNDNVAEWSPTVVEDYPLDDSPVHGVGSRFRCVTKGHGNPDQRLEFDGEVMKWDPPTMSAVELVSGQFVIRAAYTFEDLGDRRTRVRQNSVVQPTGMLMKLLFFVAGGMMGKASCSATQKELESLKQKMEAAQAE